MNRIQIGVDQADGNSFDVLGEQLPYGCAGLFDIERLLNGSVAQNSFRHFEPEGTRYKRWQAVPVDVIDVRPPLTSHFQFVAKSARRQQAGAGSGPFDDRIRGDGGAVNEVLDSVFANRWTHSGGNIFTDPVEQRQYFTRDNAAIVATNDHVGKCAADIETYSHLRNQQNLGAAREPS